MCLQLLYNSHTLYNKSNQKKEDRRKSNRVGRRAYCLRHRANIVTRRRHRLPFLHPLADGGMTVLSVHYQSWREQPLRYLFPCDPTGVYALARKIINLIAFLPSCSPRCGPYSWGGLSCRGPPWRCPSVGAGIRDRAEPDRRRSAGHRRPSRAEGPANRRSRPGRLRCCCCCRHCYPSARAPSLNTIKAI